MKEIAKDDRRLLLQMLKTAVRLQIMFWDQCLEISEILDNIDSVCLVEEIARENPGKELQLSNLNAILGRFCEIDPTAAVPNLSQKMQRTLLARIQNAVHLQRQLLDGAMSLAKALECTREEALGDVCGFAICADDGTDLDERDLRVLLREPDIKEYIRMGGPLEA
jgi:hypothetical protein